MIEEKNLLNEKGSNSLELSNQYDWNELAKRVHELYKSLLLLER